MMRTDKDFWKAVLPDLLTVKEVAALLRVHQNTVYKLIHTDKLQAHKVGRVWRIPKEGLLCLRE